MPPGSETGSDANNAVTMATTSERVVTGILGACCLAVLVLASTLTPDPAGHGTHKKLGLPECGWVRAMDTPCPTCGMTTAFSNAANRRPIAAFVAQPMGAALSVVTAAVLWGCVYVSLLGHQLASVLRLTTRPRVLWVVGALWAMSWVYKLVTWSGAG